MFEQRLLNYSFGIIAWSTLMTYLYLEWILQIRIYAEFLIKWERAYCDCENMELKIKWPAPRNILEVGYFLGLTIFCQFYINCHFAPKTLQVFLFYGSMTSLGINWVKMQFLVTLISWKWYDHNLGMAQKLGPEGRTFLGITSYYREFII